MKYKWIHLSDIHFAYKDYYSNRLRLKLFDKLKEIAGQEKISFQFITGDITDMNADYTDDLFKFISDIQTILEINHSRTFLVPGNHDVERTRERER